jgi:hypothetical protein
MPVYILMVLASVAALYYVRRNTVYVTHFFITRTWLYGGFRLPYIAA